MRAKLHSEAHADLREGHAWYRHHSPLAAVAFAEEIDSALQQIVEAPLRYRSGEHGTRELVLPGRFPYTIVYRVHGNQIVIIAVAHHSREPGYWKHRR